MVKNEVFEFTAPNGLPAVGVVVDVIKLDKDAKWYLCYSQNRLFHYREYGSEKPVIAISVDYVIMPQYDELLKNWEV